MFFESKYGLDPTKLSIKKICSLTFLDSKLLELRLKLNSEVDKLLTTNILNKKRNI